MPDAGRVIAGAAGGRRLTAPGAGTRPLADRVKQVLFAILEPDLRGATMLDLFAGSGAVGIEALSRGARCVAFVERDPGAVRVIHENLRRTALDGEMAMVIQADVLAWLRGRGQAAGPFEIVVVDPPYTDVALLGEALVRLGDPDSGLLTPRARVVAKHFWRDSPPDRIGLLASERARRFGETALTFYRSMAGENGE